MCLPLFYVLIKGMHSCLNRFYVLIKCPRSRMQRFPSLIKSFRLFMQGPQAPWSNILLLMQDIISRFKHVHVCLD